VKIPAILGEEENEKVLELTKKIIPLLNGYTLDQIEKVFSRCACICKNASPIKI